MLLDADRPPGVAQDQEPEDRTGDPLGSSVLGWQQIFIVIGYICQQSCSYLRFPRHLILRLGLARAGAGGSPDRDDCNDYQQLDKGEGISHRVLPGANPRANGSNVCSSFPLQQPV
jgi:hypothetical protein